MESEGRERQRRIKKTPSSQNNSKDKEATVGAPINTSCAAEREKLRNNTYKMQTQIRTVSCSNRCCDRLSQHRFRTEPGAAALEWGDCRAARGAKGCRIGEYSVQCARVHNQVSITETAVTPLPPHISPIYCVGRQADAKACTDPPGHTALTRFAFMKSCLL